MPKNATVRLRIRRDAQKALWGERWDEELEMIVADAVFFTYRDALRRGGPEYLAFERAVTVYRERFDEASQAEANFAVSRILAEAAASRPRTFWGAEGEAPAA